MRRLLPFVLLLIATFALVGCGGGSGGGDNDDHPHDLNDTPTPQATVTETPTPLPTEPAGTLDATFGTDGIVSILEQGDARVPRHGLRVLPDGSIEVLMVARSALLHRGRVLLVAISPDGQRIDRTDLVDADEAAFGSNGDVWVTGIFQGARTMTRFVRPPEVPGKVHTPLVLSGTSDIVPLADGGVLAVGTAGRRAGLQRLHADGALDETFGANGLLVEPHVPNDADATFFAADVGATGRIVAVGTRLAAGFGFFPFVAAYDAAEIPEATFGDGGVAPIWNGGVPNELFAGIAAAPDGSVIVVTSADVARLDPHGERDKGFTTRYASTDKAQSALVLAPSGAITVVGTTYVLDEQAPGCDLSTGAGCYRRAATVTRLGTDGTPDPRFSEDGTAFADFRALATPAGADGAVYSALALAPAGRITVAGNAFRLASSSQIVVARYVDVAD